MDPQIVEGNWKTCLVEDAAFSGESDGSGAKLRRALQQEMSAAGALIHGSIGRGRSRRCQSSGTVRCNRGTEQMGVWRSISGGCTGVLQGQ